MTLEKLDRKDVRLIAVCAVIALISGFVGVKYFFRAFPEASIEFRTTKESSLPVAEAFLAQAGAAPAGYKHAAVFGFDDQAKVFLEREVGADERAAILDGSVRLWRWQHRWFRPLEKEELLVEVTTRGEPVGFQHLLPEEAPGKDLPQAEARALAERFLTNVMHRPLETLVYVEGKFEKLPHRTDHTFTWKLKDFEVKGADYRIKVAIAGDRPAGYDESLKVPDTWIRDYEKLRSKNTTAGIVDTALLLLTAVAMLVLMVIRLRGGDIRWRTAAILGGITFVLQLFSALNSIPSDVYYRYVTTTSYSGFIVQELLQAVMGALLFGAVIFLIAAASEPLYRDRFPKFLSVTSLVRPRTFGTKEYFIASVVGITLTFFFFAYENVFYIIANSLGAWAPREVAYSDLLSTTFPWVYVLFIGWFPAISEEFISRMFSIPFFEKLLRSRIVAIVVAAFIWGFGHAAYPNQPFWIRGLEVGIAGIVFGLVMLRFGIAATVICHFSVDALYTAFVLIRSPNPYYIVSASLAAGAFALIFLGTIVGYWRRGGFLSAEMTNEQEIAAMPPEPLPIPVAALPGALAAGTAVPGALAEAGAAGEAGARPAYVPWSAGRILAGLVAAAILTALCAVPLKRFGDWADFHITRQQAQESAASFLRGCGFDVAGYRSAVTSLDRTDETAAAYLRDKGSAAIASEVYKDKVPTPVWRVRYFIPGQKEEFAVTVDPLNGAAIGFTRALAEDAPGASLDKADALRLAETFVSARGQDPKAGELKEQTEKDEKARRDHSLAWEYAIAGAGEAKIRYEAGVQGDVVGSWVRGVKVPEEWVRERDRQTALGIALRYLKIPVLGVLAGLAIVLLVLRIRSGEVPWKFALIVGALQGLIVFVSGSLKMDAFWGSSQYQTSIPAAGFWVIILISLFVGAVLFFIVGAAFGGLAGALYPATVRVFSAASRRLYARDALLAGLVAAAFAEGVPVLTRILAQAMPSGVLLEGVPYPRNVDASQPALAVLAGVAYWTLLGPAFGAVGAALLSGYFKHPLVRAGAAVLLLVSFLPASARGGAEFAFAALSLAIVGAALVVLACCFLRDNPLAWIWSAWFALGVTASIDLIGQSAGFFRWNGVIALAVILAPGLWLLKDALSGARSAVE